MIAASSGPKARGQADTDDRPYDLSYEYDELNHLTASQGRMWSAQYEADTGSGVYANGRNTAWQYDSDGRLTSSSQTTYSYDAAGRAVNVVSPDADVTLTQTQVFDGSGVRTKLMSQQEVYHEETNTTSTDTKTQYFVTSSVLNQVVTELDQSGAKTRTFIYQGSEVLAWQQKSGTTETMAWEHRDPSQASVRGTTAAAELEPLGSNAGVFKGFVIPPPRSQATLEAERSYPFFAATISGQCILDGIETPCSLTGGEGAVQCPDNRCGGWNWNQKGGRGAYEVFRAFADGRAGYMPVDAFYQGYGYWITPDGYDAEDGGELEPSKDEFFEHQRNPQNSPCEKLLARTFTDDPNIRFVDVTDGDGYDPIIQSNRTPKDKHDDEHNHIYNAESDIKKHTNIFAPAGGNVIGSGNFEGQNWMSVYYKSLGGVKNVILQIWHVENYNGRGGIPRNGRIQLGQMGENGNIRYGPPGSPEGWHVHINAYTWWGTIKNGRPVGNALGLRKVKEEHRLKLSDLFCN